MKSAYFALVSGILFFAVPAVASCPAAPMGEPELVGGEVQVIEVCHKGYASLLEPASKETRVASYELTAAHSHGKGSRAGMTFKVDALAPPESQGRASDYGASGYDLGHIAPAEDFAWDEDMERDTFSMANVAPQLPGLNRQGWERAEETIRAEACLHGVLDIYTGPLYPGVGEIGKDHLVIPNGFFKMAIDPATGWAIAFLVPQAEIAKGDIDNKLTAVATVEIAAGIRFPMPESVDQEKPTTVDTDALVAYRAGRCKTN